MTADRRELDELRDLLRLMEEGKISAGEVARIDVLVRSDQQSLRSYVEYMRLVSDLHLGATDRRIEATLAHVFGADNLGLADGDGRTPAVGAPTVFSSSAVPLSSNAIPGCAAFDDGPVGYFSSSWPIAYLVSAALVGLGLLIGSFIYVSHPEKTAQKSTPVSASASTDHWPLATGHFEFVGRVTDMVDCVWLDASTATAPGSHVPLGRKFALAAGLMEITYDSGARVILQGPCRYEVESATGGFLTVGKLTARVETKVASGQWPVASKSDIQHLTANISDSRRVDAAAKQAADQKSLAAVSNPKSQITKSPNPKSLIPNPSLSTLHSPLFTIKTPTAVVTDLGTEFGVEVDTSGQTTSRVFRGAVKLEVVGGDGRSRETSRILRENESASVALGESRKPVIRAAADNAGQPRFVRRVPRRIPIKVFSTGVGLREGDPDPHWKIVAVDNDPSFRPRQTAVIKNLSCWLDNDPRRWQWISLPERSVPANASYTFQTSFDLSGARSQTARLRMQFMADDRVGAIRINGHDVNSPLPTEIIMRYPSPEFVINSGFVEGRNTLEIDVLNIAPNENSPTINPLGLRVSLSGSVQEK